MKAFLKKNKLFTLGLVIVLMGALMVAGCGEPAEEPAPAPDNDVDAEPAPADPDDNGETFEFSLSHMWPGGHPHEVDFAQEWADDLYEASNGRIEIVTYPGATLVSGPETYEGVVQGVADLGMGVYAYTRGRFPFIETFLLPGMFITSAEGGSEAIMEGIETFDPEELHDVHHIFTFTAGEGYLMSSESITTMEDLEGMEIGVTAGPRADAINALGATDVVLPMPEWYEALDRGIMEGGISPMEALEGFRIGEVTADYMLSTPFLYNQIFFFVMNQEAWNSMPADLQEIFMEISNEYYEDMMKGLFDELNERGLEFTRDIKDTDPVINTLDPEEEQRWLELIDPIMGEYAEELNERGLPGEEILDLAQELTDKYN